MNQEFNVGGCKFVVDDPNGSLARVESHQQRVDHPENENIEVTVKAALGRQASLIPNTVDPMGSVRGRMMIYEAMADGRLGPFGLFVGWVAVGIPCLTAIAAWLRWALLHFMESGGSLWGYFAKIVALVAVAAIPGWILSLPVRATIAYVRSTKNARSSAG